MNDQPSILGIDMGSVSISVAEIGLDRKVLKTAYHFHYGNITETLNSILIDFNLQRV